MFHHPDCQKYRLWKKQRAKKLKKNTDTVRPKRRREPITDCLESVEPDVDKEIQLKITQSRCKTAKKFRVRRTAAHALAYVSLTDILLRRIKPSIEKREQLINPRHTGCMLGGTFTPPETIKAVSLPGSAYITLRRKVRRKPKAAKRKAKKKGPKDADLEDSTKDKPRETKSKDVIKGAAEVSGGKRSKGKKKKKLRRKKTRAMRTRRPEEDEESECETVCSFDSEVCLAGLKLTQADKEKIKGYRSKSGSSADTKK